MNLGLATLPTLPEAIQLLQLESINDLKETIRDQESVIAEQEAKIAKLEGEKIEIESQKSRELEKIGIKVQRHEAAMSYMTDVMLQNNRLVEEQQQMLESQAKMIEETTKELEGQTNGSAMCREATETIALQAETIDLLKSSLASAINFSNLTTSGLEQLNIAPFMLELMDSYNKQTGMLEDLNAALGNEQLIGDKVSKMSEVLAELNAATKSVSDNLGIVAQQADVINMQGKSTPFLHLSSEDIVWNEQRAESGETGVHDVAACSCLPRSRTEQMVPAKIEYQCEDRTNR